VIPSVLGLHSLAQFMLVPTYTYWTTSWRQSTRMWHDMFSVSRPCQYRSPLLISHLLKDNVIGPRGLLRDKARILVTNTVAFVRQFDSLIFMRRGIILENMSYPDAMASQGELWRLT
jgi:hypothetical protein